MTITKRIILSKTELELFDKVQEILTSVYNEVETKKEEATIVKLKLYLYDFCYNYSSIPSRLLRRIKAH